jgi:pimeloyl-ACP methyl ester carboxylesterase
LKNVSFDEEGLITSEKSASNATLDAVSHQFIETNGLRMHIAEQGTGPLVLLCHGFPELWNAWRYQFPALSEAGYRVVAPDLRGYGQTDQPDDVEVYTLLHLVGDLIGVLEVLGEQRAILVGHDWGAALAWHAALLRPDRFPVLICMSAPYIPRGPLHGKRATLPPTQAWKQAWGDQCFYQSYFQRPGVAEAEFERDVRSCGATGTPPLRSRA